MPCKTSNSLFESHSHSCKQVLKTELELNVLQNFLEWLSKLESKHGKPDGIILLYHEEHNFLPHMVLHTFQKYSLLEEFNKVIKCFLNCNNLAKTYLGNQQYTYLGLGKLTTLLSMDKEPSKFKRGCAQVRAKMVFNVALQLMYRDRKPESQSFENINNLYFILKPFTENIEDHLKALDTEVESLKREETFRPVFINYFENSVHRARALKFRMSLAENGFDLHTLQSLWREKRQEGLYVVLRGLDGISSKQKSELVGLLDSYFDPRKDVSKPPTRVVRVRRRTPETKLALETGDSTSSLESNYECATQQQADKAFLNMAKGSKHSNPKQQGKTTKMSRKYSTTGGVTKSSNK